MKRLIISLAIFFTFSPVLRAQPSSIGSLELAVGGLSAKVNSAVIPKNISSGVRISVTAGGEDLSAGEISRFLGGAFTVEGTLSGPGLTQTVDLPYQSLGVSSDPLLVLLPALPKAGYYTLENMRLVVNGTTALDVAPGTVEIIDQVLVTSVLTRALTLAEIQDKGIILTGNDYLGFQFDIGLLLSSQVVNISFPVVFDRQGQSAPRPLELPEIERLRISHPELPTIRPVLLEVLDGDGNKLPLISDDDSVGNIYIPAILVIPGDVGYLKQFFSAQLYVANGTPEGSNLVVRDVTAKITLPAGDDGVLGTDDDPLTLPDVRNEKQPETLPVLASDGGASLWPGQTGQTEFIIRGEKEGYHAIDFDIQAVLEGLATGPVTVGAKTAGAVLVRNPYFDMTFITPGIVRSGNEFNLYVSVYNISRAIANDVSVTLNQASLSGAVLLGDATQSIPTLMPGESQMLKFTFRSLRSGQVTASYLRLDTEDGSTGTLRFTLGVDSRNVPLSPDTLSLPADLSGFPADVIDAAMRVLGEAWGVANAYTGTLPSGVIRISKAAVLERALALAEAGLRHELGQPLSDVLKELAFDFWGGEPIDPGFDQLLRESAAGRHFTEVLGNHLFEPTDPMLQSDGPLEYQRRLSEIAVSGPEFILFTAASGLSAAPVEFSLTDRSGRAIEHSDLPGGVIFPLGDNGPVLGLLTSFDRPPYTLEITGLASGYFDFAITVPRGDGNVIRASANNIQIAQGQKLSLVVNAENHDGVRLYTNGSALIHLDHEVITPPGPKLVSATVFGQETFDGAGQYGFNVAVLFDRIVDKATASRAGNIVMPSNSIMSANRQLSGRFIFASLAQPEGPYVPTTVRVGGIADLRGAVGATETVNLQSRLQAPGTVVSGRVLNADGTPAAKAVVMFVGMPPSKPFMTCPQMVDEIILSSVLTDGDGFYEFRFAREGDCGNPYAIAVKDPSNGVLHSVRSFVRYAGERLVYDFVFYGAGTVSGTVYDLSGQPVPEANVYAMSGTDNQVSGRAVSDGDGRYTINGITVGAVTVRAVRGSGLGLAAGNIDSAGSTATINVTLDGGAVQVSGTVRQTVNGGGLTPVPGVPVTYYTNGTPVGYSITGHDGTYSISDMPVGQYRVFTGLNTRDTAEVQGVAAAGDHLRIDLTIVPGAYGTAEGHVKFPDGEPAAEALVYSGKSGVLTEADGSFSLPWISVNPSVSQTITARTRDGKRSGKTSVIINTPDQVVSGLSIMLSGLGSAQFTVLDAAGQPVKGQAVKLFHPYDPCNGESLITDSNGQVTFSGLEMGTVRAKAVMHGNGFVDVAEGTANVVQDGLTAFGIIRFNGVGTVSGRVLNPDGGPSHGALVDLIARVYDPHTCSLSNSTGVAQQFTTGTNGNFQFRGVPVGSVGARASQSFFPTRVSASGTLSTAGDTVNFTLQLVDTMTGELSGTVFMPDDTTPVGSGIEVTINGPLPDITVLTNAEGRFVFARILPSGRYTITARDSATGGIAREIIALKSEQDFIKDLRLKGTGTVRVEVVDGAGMPVESAFIKLKETDFPNESYDGVLSPADNGVLSFDNVFEGPFNVTVTDGFGRGGRAAAVLPPLTDAIDVKVQITTTGTVKGHFLHQDGSPVPYGIVTLTAGGRAIGHTVTSSSDVGAYSFDYVPAGTVSVSAQDPVTARTGRASATLETEGQILILDVTEGNIGTVEGTVTSNGEPQAGVTVTLIAGTFKASVTTDSSGQYSINGVPEGNVTASSSLGNGFLKGTAAGILRGEGTVLTLDIALRASGEVTGQVFEHDGVTPASLSVVTIEVGGTGGGKVVTTTDEESRFAFARVPSGSGTITVEKPASADRGRVYVVVPENDTADVNITLAGTGAIAGLALDSAGQPVRGTITLTGTGDFPYSYTLTANADGTFHVPDVIAGPFDARLRANIGGFTLYGTTSGVVLPDETLAFEIQLESSGTVAGLVLRADGATPAVGAEVTIRMQKGSSIKIQAQVDGRFTAAGVPLGAFSVRVHDELSSGIGLLEGLKLTDNEETVNVGVIVLNEATNTPVLELVSPNRFTNSTRPSICVRFTNALTGIGTFELRLDGQPVSASSSGGGTQRCYTPPAPLAEGEHSVEAEATNQAGNPGTLSAVFTVDVTPPGAATILNLTADQILQGSYTFTAEADDDLSGVARIELFSNGSRFLTLNAPDFSAVYDTNRLGNGTRSITARATDNAGNVGQESAPIRVYVSYTELKLTITSPAANAQLSSQAQVTATANKAVEEVTFTLGGQSVQVVSSPYTATFDLQILPDGVHTITVTATGAVPGETASATRDIVVDNTPPLPPDTTRINAEPSVNGVSIVHGSAGAVESRSTVRITHLATGYVYLATAAANGSFTANIIAESDDRLSLVAVDAAGNVSVPSLVMVRRLPSIPHTDGNTSLYYEGLAVDLVGLTAGEYAPDGEMDAVFTLNLYIGEELTRTVSYIELSNGLQIRSTRAGDPPLGVAVDPGSPLMNGEDGTVSFPITSGGTLTLIAGDDGFIAEGLTYTATTVFTDGARFIALYRITPAADKALVAHSATITPLPVATVVVSTAGPGYALLIIDNIRDIDGTLVPDGAKIAVTAANMASMNPIGTRYTSAGGTISGGEPAANNPDFQVFDIEDGSVTVLYSSAPVTPTAVTGAQALIQVQAADYDGNVLGTKAIATLDINIRRADDRALVSVYPTQLYADGTDRRASFAVIMQDAAGNPVPDGTPVLVSATQCAAWNPSGSCISSAGGQIIGGQDAAAGNNYRLFFTSEGKVAGEYSSSEVSVAGRSASDVVIQVLSSTDIGEKTASRAIGTARLSLTGATAMIIEIVPETLAYTFFPEAAQAQVFMRQIRDQRAGLVPDGGRILVSAASCASWNPSGSCVSSAGGSIVDGYESPLGASYRVFTVYQGRATATYSVDGVTDKPGAGETKTVNIQILMPDHQNNKVASRAVQVEPLRLLGPGNAAWVASPPSLLGDGGLNISTVTFGPVLDTYGNVFPDGTKVIAAAASCAGWNPSGSCISSAGGQILNGEASPSGIQYKVLTVQNGKLVVEYGSQGVTTTPGQINTANVVLLPANSDGSRVSSRAFAIASVSIAGLASATATVSPSGIFADNTDHRAFITLTDFRNAAGHSVPDGAMIAVSAKPYFATTNSGSGIFSDGGEIIGNVVPSWDANARIFTITNGQIVFEYSSIGVSSADRQRTAVIQVRSVTPQTMASVSSRAAMTIPVQLLTPGSAIVELRPSDLLANGGDHRSQVVISGLLEADGVTPIPDGVKVGLTVANCAASPPSGSCYSSAGGTILSAGTSPDDGTVAANNANFRIFTVAGGQVQAIYSAQDVTSVAGQTKTVRLSVVPAGTDGSILRTRSIASSVLQLHGITYATASGPESISRLSGDTAAVTFSGITDTAGNPVPDGTLVLASANSCASYPQSGSCYSSVGGTILDGEVSPAGSQYKVFAVKDGSVTVTYSPGTSNGTARIQLIPAYPDGRKIGNFSLIGGVWLITVTN